MKKVLFVATVTSHINTFHIPYLKWFKEQGYEVHVASNGNVKIEYCDKHYDLPFERFPLKKNNLKTYRELKKIINDNEYEIIHCHTPVGGVLTRLAARKARKHGTKVIYTAHGFHFYKGAPIKNWIVYYPIEKICAKWTDCLITITEEDFELAKKKIRAKEIKHINGVGMDTKKFEKVLTENEKDEKRKELSINKNDIVFSYVAELNKNKNQILLINTIKELKEEIQNIKLLLIGNGPLLQEYKEVIRNNNLEDNIMILGKRSDINELLSITDIYLASSLREGLPVNIMEAMYKGLPIIAIDNRGHRELVKDQENGFIIKTKEEMQQKIKEILKDKGLQEKLIKKGKEKVKQYLIYSVMSDMEKTYKNSQKIKVIHLLNSSSYSGAEKVIIKIIEEINKEENKELIYVSPEGNIKQILEKTKISYIPIKEMSRKEIKRIYQEQKPDIMHMHDFRASIIGAFSNLPTYNISHIHKNDPKMRKINFYSILYLIATMHYDKILLVSESIKEEFVFKKSIKKKIEIIGNPIDTREILQKAKEEKNNKEYDILYLGRLSQEKNPIEYIEIVHKISKSMPNIKCAMIGDGPLKEECKNLIKEERLEQTIEMLGFLENPYAILKNAKVMCITSNWEGFGLAAIEALTLGVPVITRNVGGLKNIVDDTCGKLVENKKEYIEEIEKLLNEEELRKEKSKKAIQKAKNLENIETYTKNIIRIYGDKNE